MKKIFMLLLLLSSLNLSLSAQNMQEVVYLKNGSIIKGVVIEQVPGESLKIQTYDGSIFVYKMSEVEKIIKNQLQKKYVTMQIMQMKYKLLMT